VGVVGRTGAGKSSLVGVLFRLLERDRARPGSALTIDGVETSGLGLHDLRLRMSVIPQTPFLFSGTVRENLDPFDKIEDDGEFWSALAAVRLDGAVKAQGGLGASVAEGGGNWSVGQRQLLCLGRALLARHRVLVLDEATANVDLETDGLIQDAVRTKFQGCTVIMIAHRLHTVIDCDQILVLGDGRVVEQGAPHTLLQKHGGGGSSSKAAPPPPRHSFRGMVEEAGPQAAAELRRLAREHHEARQRRKAATPAAVVGSS